MSREFGRRSGSTRRRGFTLRNVRRIVIELIEIAGLLGILLLAIAFAVTKTLAVLAD